MPCYTFLYYLYNLNYVNIPLKLIFGKKQKFDVKNQSPDFLWNYQHFDQNKLSGLTLILAILQIISQKNLSLFFLMIFSNEILIILQKIMSWIFLHQISVFSEKSVSEEYYDNLSFIIGIKMCNMAFGRKFSLVFGK